MIQHKSISIDLLDLNNGQIEGLPSNPRQWTRDDLDRLKASISETPELFEARGCLVIPYGDRYVVLGGNMRLSASKELGHKTIPCHIIPADTPTSKLKELVIKDNGEFGKWDWDALGNEWDDCQLDAWGVDASFLTDEDWNNLPQVESAPKPPVTAQKITISVPSVWSDSMEGIKEAVKVTLEEWQGCEVK